MFDSLLASNFFQLDMVSRHECLYNHHQLQESPSNFKLVRGAMIKNKSNNSVIVKIFHSGVCFLFIFSFIIAITSSGS